MSMKRYFFFLLCSMMLVVFTAVSCDDDPNREPDPCEADPQPGCPNYVDPCEEDPQPGCPNYVDPCETDPQPGCPDYVDPCETDPKPGCPNFVDNDPPVLGVSITIGANSYTVSEKLVEKLDDGIWYMNIQLKNSTKPLVVHTVRYATGITGYGIETWVAHDCITGRESPGSMVKRYEDSSREVRMAINGGFYGTEAGGTPIGMQAINGLLTFFPQANFPIIGFDSRNLPYMDFVELDSRMKIEKSGNERTITSVNGGRWTDYLVLYNSYKGKSTGANQWGIELLCAPVTAEFEQLDNYIGVRCRVERIDTRGNMEIPKGKFVLSGHGLAHSYLNTMQQGDFFTLSVDYFLKTNPSITSTTVRNIVSGWNIILNRNEIMEYFTTDALERTNNPRTAAGFTTDREFVYFTVVEGRQDNSVGVTTKELAQVMQYFGATHAINLDGGGSSCMMIDKTLINSITGGTWQRPVADGIAIIKK